MPNGGRLRIEAKQAFRGHESESVDGRGGHQSKVLIQVSDTGGGMSLETQSHMFKPFFHEGNERETWTHRGLWHCETKCRPGRCCQPGQGTVVRVALSLAGQGRSPARAILANVSAKGQETVLLVEPNEIDRKLVLSTLLRHRYQVLEASSAVEALLRTQQYAAAVYVAVSDLIMPEIGARDLARRLLKQHPMMNGSLSPGMTTRRRYLLRRPYRQTGLVERVREQLDA